MALLKVAALAGCLSVAAADSKTCTPGCSATRGGDPCTTDANDPDDLTGSCFFNACTCEYRGTVSGCSTNDACAGWKQTGGCSASGSLEPDNHLACCEYVPTGASGYCECGTNGNKVREVVRRAHRQLQLPGRVRGSRLHRLRRWVGGLVGVCLHGWPAHTPVHSRHSRWHLRLRMLSGQRCRGDRALHQLRRPERRWDCRRRV